MLRSLAFGIPIAVTLLDCFGYVAKVEGISMQPSLNPDADGSRDFVFLNRWYSRSFSYNRGEVVSVLSPKDPSQKIIKRIIGLEGDLVCTIGYKHRYYRIPPGHCWIEGDNTGHSLDSNLFGPISLGLITAKASHIVWPPSRWSKLEAGVPDKRVPLNLKESSNKIISFQEFVEFMDDE